MFSFINKFLKNVIKPSYSVLSITLSCEDSLYVLSKHLKVCWSFSYCFLYLLYLFMIILYKTLFSIENRHAVADDIGITIKPIPVRLKVIKLNVVAIITNVSNDFSVAVIVL